MAHKRLPPVERIAVIAAGMMETASEALPVCARSQPCNSSPYDFQ
jgi:hypothetical protein